MSTCLSVSDVDGHKILLEVQIVVSIRIKNPKNVRGDLGGVTYNKFPE